MFLMKKKRKKLVKHPTTFVFNEKISPVQKEGKKLVAIRITH